MNVFLTLIGFVLACVGLLCILAAVAVHVANNSKSVGKRRYSKDEFLCILFASVFFLISYSVWP